MGCQLLMTSLWCNRTTGWAAVLQLRNCCPSRLTTDWGGRMRSEHFTGLQQSRPVERIPSGNYRGRARKRIGTLRRVVRGVRAIANPVLVDLCRPWLPQARPATVLQLPLAVATVCAWPEATLMLSPVRPPTRSSAPSGFRYLGH